MMVEGAIGTCRPSREMLINRSTVFGCVYWHHPASSRIIPVVWFNNSKNWVYKWPSWLYFQIVEENNYMFPHSWCPHCSIWVFSDILVSTWWWHTQKRTETCSCFLQKFENTVVLGRTFIHLISTTSGVCLCGSDCCLSNGKTRWFWPNYL
jgi:hypothetical protein